MDLPDWVARRSLALRQPWRRPPLDVPGWPRASPGCTAREISDWSAMSPFTRMVSGSVSVVLATTTFVNDRYKPGWSASLPMASVSGCFISSG